MRILSALFMCVLSTAILWAQYDPRLDHSSGFPSAVTSPAERIVAEVEDWGECTFEKDTRQTSRVDDDCKDVLDKTALRLSV